MVFEKIQLVVLQKIFYLLSIFVLILGVVEYFRNKKYRKLDIKSKAEKTTELAFSPESQAEELIRTVSIYRKAVNKMLEKIKRFFKYVYCNKETLANILLNLFTVGCLEYLFISDLLLSIPFFAEHYLIVATISGLLSFIYVIFSTHAIALSCGWEKPEQFEKRILEKKAHAAAKLDKDTAKAIKGKLAEKEKALKESIKKFDKAAKDFDVLTKLQSLSGYTFTNEDALHLQEAQNIKINENCVKVSLTDEINSLKNQLKK